MEKDEEKLLLKKGSAIRCPSCGGIITNVNKVCPNCGCSDTLKFQKIAKKEYLNIMPDGTLGYFTLSNPASQETNNSSSTMANDVPFEVNPDAERVANGVAGFILTISIIIGAICVISGLVAASDYTPQAGVPLIGAGLILIILGIIAWASIKLFVNISRSLYNIHDSIQRIQTLVEKK